VGGKVVLERSNNSGDDKMAGCHPDSTGNQNTLPAEFVHPEDGRNGKDKLHDTHNTSCKEINGVTGQADTLEDKRAVQEIISAILQIGQSETQLTRNN